MAITIAACARKGGVGKTMLTASIAANLADLSKARVLLIDCDGQNSLTSYFYRKQDAEELGNDQTATAFFDDAVRINPNRMIHPTHKNNVSIVPANESLTYHNWPNITEQPKSRRHSIRQFVEVVSSYFDYILIDNGPTLRSLPNWAALVASDYVICPAPPETFAGRGIAPVQRFIEAAQTENPSLHLLGYVVNMVDNRWASHTTNQLLMKKHHEHQIFDTVIPRLSDFQGAIDNRMPITEYKKNGNAAALSRTLAKEVFTRIKEHEQAKRKPAGQEAA